MQCNYYYTQNIMLGNKIVIPACAFDYYNHSVNNTQFLLQNEIHPKLFHQWTKTSVNIL